METISAYPATPNTQISHMRHSSAARPSKSNPAQQETRSMQAPETTYLQPLSAPASQKSFISTRSDASSVQPPLQTSNNNLSQLTNYTDPTSPAKQQHEQRNGTAPASQRRAITPEEQQDAVSRADYALASPMSVVSPATNGAKRTASGHVKNAPSLPSTPLAATFADRISRRESISSTGSRAGELAATLKTRLGYAMAKVQHGWEHKTIAEVEQLATQKMSSPNRHSMSHVDYSHRPVSAGLSNGTARLSMYESYGPPMMDDTTSPPSKRRSGNYSNFMASPQQPRPAWSNAPHLQPPADIRPGTSSTQQMYYSAPSSQTSAQHLQNAMSPPRTPLNGHSSRRPTTIRTDIQIQEAESEALQALFQLGSPHTSQISRQQNNASQASSSQASPQRTEYPTPRRVTFARSESGSSARGSSAEGAGPEA
ncbi:hypothetical protein LTR27_002459 [Elasticomyces elasticus]|nr:hypothetical protein LTR27_002459 [Elasticomyces elasticus]